MKRKKQLKIEFLNMLNEVSQQTQIKKSVLYLDLLLCKMKYGATKENYFLFSMYNLNKYERRTILTKGKNKELMLTYNDPKYFQMLQDKEKFHQTFSKYLNRDWLMVSKNKNEFAKFCIDYHKIIVKQKNGIIKMRDTEISNLKNLYEELTEDGPVLLEEAITECDKLKKLNPNCTKKIHVTTLLGRIVMAHLEISKKSDKTISFFQEGMIAQINIETGKIDSPAIDKEGTQYETCDNVKTKMVGFQIPKWNEIKELCEETSLEIPHLGYVTWEICIGKDKLYLMDATYNPQYDIYSYLAAKESNTGLLTKIKIAEERKYEE